MKKFTTLFFMTITAWQVSRAQIVPTLTYTPQQLVQNYLVGPGITVSGVTFNGMPGTTVNPQIGFFSGTSSIGLDSGVVMASGFVSNVTGPNNSSTIATSLGIPSFDPDLNAICAAGIVFDAAILEFDFVPTGDTVQFSFVFGSDEYMEYAGSPWDPGVNDAFGIFLSGPGITGGYSSFSENIATIPGGVPVSIDNVNMFVNPSYYVDNGNGFSSPYSVNPFYIEYDGFTVRLTAKWAVTCGSTYHIKFAIGDAGDDWIDSGVFIEAGSFTSSGSTVAVTVPPVTGAGPNAVFEGCDLGSSVDYVFTRPDTTGADTVYFTIGGDAINGVDYSLITPNYIVFAPGQSSSIITVNVFDDGIIEGIDTLIITLDPTATPCSSSSSASVVLYIHDPYTVHPFAGNDTVYYCPGQTVVFNGIALDGNAPYDFSWSDGTMGATVNYTISSMGSDSLILTVTDGCGYTGTDTLILTQVTPSVPLEASAGADVFYTCPGDSSLVIGYASGGVAPYTYLWEGTTPGPTYYYVASTDTVVVLTVTDFCGNTDSDTLYAIQNPPIPLVADGGPDINITCPGQLITFNGTYTGGAGSESFFWYSPSLGTMLSNPFIAQPLTTEYYVFTVMNTCGQMDQDSVLVTVAPHTPLTLSLTDDTLEVNCAGMTANITATAGGGTAPYGYSWSNMDTDSTTSVNILSNGYLALTVTDACGLDTIVEIPLVIVGGNIELDFPNGRYCRNSDSTAGVPLTITGGIAPYSYTWSTQPGGSVSIDSINFVFNILNPVTGYYNLTITDACGASDTDSGQVIMQDCDLDIPNVMTPNGDGINDVFYIDGLSAHPNTILQVFNRWGAMVYNDSDYDNSWNGGGLAAGVYFYIIKLTDGTVPSEYHGYLNIFY